VKDIQTLILEIAKKQRNTMEEILSLLPDGVTLCIHEDPTLFTSLDLFTMNYKYTMAVEAHVFFPNYGHRCNELVQKTQYNKGSREKNKAYNERDD
jgi:hypothetical protein